MSNNKYADGICLEKKEINKNKGIKNQYIGLLFLKANTVNRTEINEKMAAWWSMKGVPADGYAKIAIDSE